MLAGKWTRPSHGGWLVAQSSLAAAHLIANRWRTDTVLALDAEGPPGSARKKADGLSRPATVQRTLAEEAGEVAFERLTAEDELMLWPDRLWPQDIGAIVMLDGTRLLEPDGRFRIEVVREVVAGRLHLVPRFRQLLRVPPRSLGAPFWVDASKFDIAEHVRELRVPAPGDEAQQLVAVEWVRRHRLDRSRPLWEMWFLTGLPGRRVALFVRMHHCIADGMAGVATIASFLDASPDVASSAPRAWTPAPGPTDAELLADERVRARRRRKDSLLALAHPLRALRLTVDAWPALRELLAEKPLPATSLDCVVGPHRRLALVRTRLDTMKEIAHAHEATVNDVLLTAVAGGLRRLLASRGEPVEGAVLRSYVPVSLHAERPGEARGNMIGQMVVPLPLGFADPAVRLSAIASETALRKRRMRPPLGKMPHRPGLLGRAFLKLLERQHGNVATANMPGPNLPLHLAGAPVLEVFPLLQLIAKVSVGVGAISYAGQFNLLVLADGDGYPDLGEFTAGLEADLVALDEALARPSHMPERVLQPV